TRTWYAAVQGPVIHACMLDVVSVAPSAKYPIANPRLMPNVTTAPRIGTMRTHGLLRGTSSIKRPKRTGTKGKTSINCMSVRPRRRGGVHAEEYEVQKQRRAACHRQAIPAQIAALPSARQFPERRCRRRK